MAERYFDELRLGQTFQHAIQRTLTESDNVWFSAIIHNTGRPRLDEEYCRAETVFGQRALNSAVTLGFMVGDTTLGAAIANPGWDEMRFPEPIFDGNTIRLETEVIELRELKGRPSPGLVIHMHRAFNQCGELIGHCKCNGLQHKKSVT